VGKGNITYLGTLPEERLMADLLGKAVESAGAAGEPFAAELPSEVEACVRKGSGRSVLVLINHANTAKSVRLKQPYRNLLAAGVTQRSVSSVMLAAQGVAVLQQEGGVR